MPVIRALSRPSIGALSMSNAIMLTVVAVAAVTVVSTSPAEAATRLVVTVTNAANSAPLDGAYVCVGTSANRTAVGRRTTSNGLATFESVGEGNWTVTVWRTGFAVATSNVSVIATTPATTTRAFVLSAGSAPDPCGPTNTTVRLDGTAIYPVAPTPAPTTQTYTAPGVDAVARARQRGFNFSTIVGPCDFAAPNSTQFGNVTLLRLGPSGLFGGTQSCSVNVFTAGTLAAGWQFVALTWERVVNEGNCTIATPPLPNQRILVPLAVQGSRCGFILRTIQLRGPSGSTWQSAFGQ
jgi:hypothetical protein